MPRYMTPPDTFTQLVSAALQGLMSNTEALKKGTEWIAEHAMIAAEATLTRMVARNRLAKERVEATLLKLKAFEKEHGESFLDHCDKAVAAWNQFKMNMPPENARFL